ncbi:MAG: hypothetical protein Q8941_03390 [Bacteroidota bacterium]|nr:hypothetical protein [Bacteroidota bacterium]
MLKKYIIVICLVFVGYFAFPQNTKTDTLPLPVDNSLAMDTSINYDELLNGFDNFLDSILAPRSYFLVNLSAGSGYFNYVTRNNIQLSAQKKLILSPLIGYYHKSGPGITVSANAIRERRRNYNLYQYSITPSFDFIQNTKWTGGISFTRHITRDSLHFYTTPLQKEMAGYFLWRKSWLQPGLSASYGWGSRTDLKKRQSYLTGFYLKRWLQLRTGIQVIDTFSVIDTIVTNITTKESIIDFSLTASLRHTFYWLNIFGHNDYIKFTAMLASSFGTQQFGFNQAAATPVTTRNAAKVQFNRGDVNLDDKLKFQPLSLTLYLRPEYYTGKFFIQPQLMIDYYFPGEKDNLTTFFSINAGFMF